ncbi:unnamed protein product [Lampetra planeri]
MELRKGEMVGVYGKFKEGWLRGLSLRTGKVGILPSNYITPVLRTSARLLETKAASASSQHNTGAGKKPAAARSPAVVLALDRSNKPEKQEVSDNVKVVVRCRPLNQKEKMMGHKQAVIVDEIRGTITVSKLETSHEPPKTFTFDTVFGPDSKQLDVYNLTARPIVDSVLEGYNGFWFVSHIWRFTMRRFGDLLGKDQMQRLECANIGPADYNYDETISTLRYANRAKNIKNKARINEDPKDALLRQFQKEIEDLKKKLEEGEEISGSDGSGSEEMDEADDDIGEGRRRRRGKKKVSADKMVEMQAKIEEERKALEAKLDMEEEERNKARAELEKREKDLLKAQQEHHLLLEKLSALEKKVIVGGVDLLAKAEEQEKLLQESNSELEERRRRAERLRKELEEKEQERLDIEEKYTSLQEEAQGKTKKLKKVWTMLMAAKSEMADLQQEHHREIEGLLENIRQLSRELRLQMLIIDNFIPQEYQEMIEHYVHWNDDIGEWQLKCVAYTGNNMRKQTPAPDKKEKDPFEVDLSHVYLAYTEESMRQSLMKLERPKTSKSGKSGRPKTGRRKRSTKPEAVVDSLLQ